jgi:triosephosphate isomerase
MIWVNFKLYKETFNDGVLRLAEVCFAVAEATKVKIIPVVSPLDLWRVKEKFQKEVWLQHADPFFEGARTGWISPLQSMVLGADGTLLNHSEHKISPGKIRQILSYLKKDKWVERWQSEVPLVKRRIQNFKTMVCFSTKGQAKRWVKRLKLLSDFVAYEPPELIGGEVSVSQAQPEVIKRIVDLLPEQKIVVGAGIKTDEDVREALRLGARGILVSSSVVKASNPKKKLKELASAFKD